MRAARVFRRLCDAYDALLIVNDHPELAIACGADGVHVGQDDRRASSRCARLVGDELLIGALDPLAGSRSMRSPAPTTSRSARSIATPTKPDYEPVGLELVRYAASTRPFPFSRSAASIPATSPRSRDAGARRVAVVRAIRDADDPGAAARTLADGARQPTPWEA